MDDPRLYADPKQPAVTDSARLPAPLLAFAMQAVQDALKDPRASARALGEYLTEPKPTVWFDEDGESEAKTGGGWRLDRRSRMLYDDHHVFINGEGFRAGGRDATLMHLLADQRHLTPAQAGRLSPEAAELVADWHACGWVHPDRP